MPKLELDLSPEIIEWIENMDQEFETDASWVVTYLWYFHEKHQGKVLREGTNDTGFY